MRPCSPRSSRPSPLSKALAALLLVAGIAPLSADEPAGPSSGFTIPSPTGPKVPVPGTDAGDRAGLPGLPFELPPGLTPFDVPEDNPLTRESIELGRKLYFDPRLSDDKTVSCATCHDPQKGWSNGEPFATGVRGQKGGRSAPTILNSAYSSSQFWDGRAADLEEQALGPIQNPIEMNLTLDELEKRLKAIPGYVKEFEAIYEDGVTALNAGRAIASFERTIVSGDAPFDRFERGDTSALSEKAQAGKKLFFGKANCSACHTGPHFSDSAFHNIGIGMDKPSPDEGRAAISKLRGDMGAFRTPTLREIARTAPYMHDGSKKTLRDVVEYYNQGGTDNDYLDEEIYKLSLTPEQVDALVAFLEEGLSSENYPLVTPPDLPR